MWVFLGNWLAAVAGSGVFWISPHQPMFLENGVVGAWGSMVHMSGLERALDGWEGPGAWLGVWGEGGMRGPGVGGCKVDWMSKNVAKVGTGDSILSSKTVRHSLVSDLCMFLKELSLLTWLLLRMIV